MIRFRSPYLLTIALVAFTGGCASKKPPSAAAEEPPPANVEMDANSDSVRVAHPEEFPVVTASSFEKVPSVTANGTVAPDVARQVPVISLASGRVIEIHARLGDEVKKGQLLMRIQSADVSGAFSEYQKALADEKLAASQLERAKDLKEKGAISQKDLDVSQNAEDDAKVEVQNTSERLNVLGVERNHPTGVIDIRAPLSGVITEQNVTAAGGVKSLDSSSSLFTISDLSQVWIICDVYENDLPKVHVGEFADVHVSAYPNTPLKGRISEIGPVLDPNLRSAKVRLQVPNPGMLRIGMFVTATFRGSTKHLVASVPASSILHLHDRDWVYVPSGPAVFRRTAVVGGDLLPSGAQEVLSGLNPGERVVSNALVLQNTVEQ